MQSLPEFFMVLLQGSPSVQLLPHGSFSRNIPFMTLLSTNGPSACCPIHNPLFAASNTAACWNSANCPAVFQSRSHVSGNKQDQLHETLDVPHDGQVCTEGPQSVVFLQSSPSSASCGDFSRSKNILHPADEGP